MRPKPILHYSSPADERRRQRGAKEERREALDRYNESTFGERRPIASALLRIALFAAVVAVVMWFLPRGVGRLVGYLLLVAFAVWEVRKRGWGSGGWTSFRYPWRRW